MNKTEVARKIVAVAKLLVAYTALPDAKKRPMGDGDAKSVAWDVLKILEESFGDTKSVKRSIGNAMNRVSDSRVNLNFVQIGAQAPGSFVNEHRMRRIHDAVLALKKAHEQLDTAYMAVSDAESYASDAMREIRT